ncbi:MAG: hypothetical protein R3C15_14535 [Thermoleophilia bacterium]
MIGPRTLLRTSLAALAALAGLALAGPGAAALDAPECPAALPLGSFGPGLVGTGLTTTVGRERVEFTATVLGVRQNALGPGRAMIVARLSGPAIDAVGGGWEGMSGSPVYVDGQLLGAVAYGLSSGPSPIVGLTTGQDILGLLATTPVSARRVDGRSLAASGAAPLPLALTVGGAAGPDAAHLLASLDRAVPVLGAAREGSASAAAATAGPLPAPGQPVAQVVAAGDVTIAASGTVTVRCGDRAVAFGHPGIRSGTTRLSARAVDAITVLADPAGPFLLGDLAEPVGAVVRDGAAGIVLQAGAEPRGIVVGSTVRAPDTGVTRTGETRIFLQPDAPLLAGLAIQATIEAVTGGPTGGTAEVRWQIRGADRDGDAWRLRRSDLVASAYEQTTGAPGLSDASGPGGDAPLGIAGSFPVWADLYNLLLPQDEDVAITDVGATVTIEPRVRRSTIRGVDVAVGRAPFDEARAFEEVFVGRTDGRVLRVRVHLGPFSAGPERTVVVRVPIPAGFGATSVGVSSGAYCELCGPTLASVLRGLRASRRSDLLVVRVSNDASETRTASVRVDGVVRGDWGFGLLG